MLLDFTDNIHDEMTITHQDILDKIDALKHTHTQVRELAFNRSLAMLSKTVKEKLADVQQKTLQHIEEFTAISDNVEKSNNFIVPLTQIKAQIKQNKNVFNQNQWKQILAYHYSDQSSESSLRVNNPILNKYARQLTSISL